MKSTILLVIASFGFVFSAHAQTATPAWQHFYVGPLFSAGEGVSAGTVADGSKTSQGFAFSAGADADYTLNESIGVNLAFAYDSRAISFYDQAITSFTYQYSLNYFSIRPEIRFGDFLIGVGIGIPASINTTVSGIPAGTDAIKSALHTTKSSTGDVILASTSTSTTESSSDMNTLFEIRLGASIPILQMASGQLDFTIDASYAFTNIVSNGPLLYNDPTKNPPSSDNNGPLASGEIGIKYLFDLESH